MIKVGEFINWYAVIWDSVTKEWYLLFNVSYSSKGFCSGTHVCFYNDVINNNMCIPPTEKCKYTKWYYTDYLNQFYKKKKDSVSIPDLIITDILTIWDRDEISSNDEEVIL